MFWDFFCWLDLSGDFLEYSKIDKMGNIYTRSLFRLVKANTLHESMRH